MEKNNQKRLEIIGVFSYNKPVIGGIVVGIDISKIIDMSDDEREKHITESLENSIKKEMFISGECFEPFFGEIVFQGAEFEGVFTGEGSDAFGEFGILGVKADDIIKFTKKYKPKKSSPAASKKPLNYILNYSGYGWSGFWEYEELQDTKDAKNPEEEKINGDGKAFCAFNEIIK
ncbi:MAG: hypothetical protein V1865_03275 [bacterium]